MGREGDLLLKEEEDQQDDDDEETGAALNTVNSHGVKFKKI